MPHFPFRTPANFIIKAHRAILLGAALLTVISVLLIVQLRIDFSLDSLLPAGDPHTQQLIQDLKDAGTQDVLIGLVSLQRSDQFEGGKTLVDDFVREMEAFPGIGAIEASLSSRQRAFLTDVLLPHAAFYLSESDRQTLLERLSDSAITSQIRENKRFLMMPMQGGAGELILRDPLNLRTMWLSRWLNEQATGNLRIVDGYLADRDRRHLLIFMHPRESARNVDFTKRLMAAAHAASDNAINKWRSTYSEDSDAPSITFAGGYPIALEDETLTRSDLQTSLLVSIVGVNLLFFLVFRNVRILFLVLVPLAMAIAWTFGFMKLVFGHVSVLTGAFGGVLLGLATDFAIYFLNFYLEAYRRDGCEEAIRHAFEKSGRGVVTGGVTSAAGFLTLGIASFRGFRELGIITGVGLLLCLGSMLIVLPAFLVWDDRRRRGPWPVEPVSGFGLDRLFGVALRFPRGVLTGCVLMLVLLGAFALRVSFDEDMRSLRPKHSEQSLAQKEVESILGGAGSTLQVTMEGDDEANLLNRAVKLNQALDRLRSSGEIAHYRSVLAYLPAPDTQREVIRFLQAHAEDLNPDRIEASFREALSKNGFQWLPEYDSYLRWLRTLVMPATGLDRDAFERAGVASILSPFLIRTETGFKLFTPLNPKGGLWTKADLDTLSADLSREALESGLSPEQWRLGGFPMLAYHLKEHVWDDLGKTVALASLAIAGLVVVSLGGVGAAALAATPLVAGLIGMLGGISLLSMHLNFANFVVLPMMIGICINDGVLIMNTRRQMPSSDLASVLKRIGRAVLLTSLTTLMGFGSLVCSHYPGLQSIGWLSGLGILSELSASLIMLPALLAWLEQRTARRSLVRSAA